MTETPAAEPPEVPLLQLREPRRPVVADDAGVADMVSALAAGTNNKK